MPLEEWYREGAGKREERRGGEREGGIVIESLESKRMKKKIEQDLRSPIEYRGPGPYRR